MLGSRNRALWVWTLRKQMMLTRDPQDLNAVLDSGEDTVHTGKHDPPEIFHAERPGHRASTLLPPLVAPGLP